MTFTFLVLAVLGQTFNPPPVKTATIAEGEQRLGADLGWGRTSGLVLETGPGREMDFDFAALPSLNLTWEIGLADGLGVGAQLFWAHLDFKEGPVDDPLTTAFDESTIDYGSTATLDAFITCGFSPGGGIHVAPFLGLGLTSGGRAHGQLGLIADAKVSESVTLAPYLRSSVGDYANDDADMDDALTSYRAGINVVWTARPGLAVVADLAYENQDFEIDLAIAEGAGVAFGLGVQYTLPR